MRRALLVLVALAGLLLVLAGGAGVAWWAMSGPAPVEYTVVRGDTLGEIATEYGVTVEQLRQWNGIDGDLIEVGQVLLIHDAAPAPGTAEGPPRTRPRPRPAGSAAAPAPSGPRGLSMPAEKACLAGPSVDDLQAEEGAIASQGLSQQAISSSMSGFVSNVLPCIAGSPSQALTLEITVACNGRVSNIAVVDAGDWSSSESACVVDTLRYTPFPAHDLPDGESFVYPLRFTR